MVPIEVKVGQVWEWRSKDGEVYRHTIKRIEDNGQYAWSEEGWGAIFIRELGTGPVASGAGEFVLVEGER